MLGCVSVWEREREFTVNHNNIICRSPFTPEQISVKSGTTWEGCRETETGRTDSHTTQDVDSLGFSFNRISFILSLLHRKWWIRVWRGKIPFILTKHTFEWTKKKWTQLHLIVKLSGWPRSPAACVSAAWSGVTRRSSRSFSESVKAPKMLPSARQHQSLQAVLPSEMECWCIPLFKVRPGVKGQPREERH